MADVAIFPVICKCDLESEKEEDLCDIQDYVYLLRNFATCLLQQETSLLNYWMREEQIKGGRYYRILNLFGRYYKPSNQQEVNRGLFEPGSKIRENSK